MSKIEIEQIEDGLAKIDGSNIPAGTFWSQFKAGGMGNYIYVDAQENDFSRVMVWKDGGWAWANKDGFSSWLGLDALKADLENFGGRNYAPGTRAEFETRVFSGWGSTIAEATVKEAETYTARVYIKANPNNDRNIGIRIFWYDVNNNSTETTTSNTILPGAEGYAIKTATAPIGTVYCRVYLRAHTSGGVNNSVEFKELKLEKGTIPTDWTPAPEDHISDWNESDNTKFSFVKNKPTLVNNYVDSIIHTNGTTAGTVYTFKRVGLSDLTLQLTAASAQFSGVVTTAAQQFEGPKEFLKSPKVPNALNADEAVNKSQMDAGDLPGQTAFGWGDFKNFGLGTNAIATNNWDIIDKTGMYYNPNTNAIGAPATQGLMTCFHQNINSSVAIQIANRSGGTLMWFRRKSAGVWQPWVEIYHSGNFNPTQYVMQSSLNTQLSNYVPINGVTTINNTKTFTSSPIVPNGTLNGHTVNLGQLNNILDDYATETWVTQQIQQISLTPGPKGDKGDKGDKPAHSWSGTQLRFENPNGTWGAYVDLKGDDGYTPIKGVDYFDGIDGKTILSGTSNPTGSIGTIGDWYLNRTTWTMFEKTGATTWANRGVIKGADGTNGINGTNGIDGSKWYSGTSNPASGTGVIGDWYVNTNTWDVFEKTGASTWTNRGNIRGPQGIQGPPGQSGSSGPVDWQVVDTGVGNVHIPIGDPITIYHIQGNGLLHISVDDGQNDGDILNLPVCGSPELVFDMNGVDKCGYSPPTAGATSGGSSWIWSANHGLWIQKA